MESLGQCEIAAICQRSLNELFSYTHVFEAIEELTIGHTNIELLKHLFATRVEVEAHVIQPVKLGGRDDLLTNQLLRNLTLMY